MNERWFVLPPTTDNDRERPGYVERDGIDGYAGSLVDFSDPAWSDLPFHGTEQWVTRVYGTTAGLDAIEAESDAYGREEYGFSRTDVASFLNDRFGGDRTFAEWTGRMFITLGES